MKGEIPMQDQEHQCCGKCEKPLAEQVVDDFAAVMEKISRPGAEPTHYSRLGSQPAPQYTDLEQRLAADLHAAQHLLIIATRKLGGTMVVTPEDGLVPAGSTLNGDVDPETGNYVLTLVPAPADPVQ